jgi:hypothetical protein
MKAVKGRNLARAATWPGDTAPLQLGRSPLDGGKDLA